MKIVWVALFLSAHCELTLTWIRKHFFIDNPVPWSDAQKICRENYVDLSTIDSQEELTRFNTDTAGQVNTVGWVGLSKPSANGSWVWSDGSKDIFIKWRSDQPNNPNNEFCARSLAGELLDYICDLEQPFFCYKWVPELILVTENKSWEEALEHCRSKYLDLASLPTSLLLLQAQNKSAVTQTPSVWTGLRFLSGSWFWVSGESLGNLVQLPACPANGHDCGSLNLETKSWENRDCEEKLNFVCYEKEGDEEKIIG